MNKIIFRVTADDPEGKTFTVTTVSQRKFSADDPVVFTKLRDMSKQAGVGCPSLEHALGVFKIPPTSLIKPPSSVAKTPSPGGVCCHPQHHATLFQHHTNI